MFEQGRQEGKKNFFYKKLQIQQVFSWCQHDLKLESYSSYNI